jgi:hypothetical protein
MMTRKQFFREALTQLGRTAAQVYTGLTGPLAPEIQHPQANLSLTELSPSLLAMEAERLTGKSGQACSDALRRRLYAQMADRARQPGPDNESNP